MTTITEARSVLFTAYQTGQASVIREKVTILQKRASLLFSVAQLGGKAQKMKRANALDHYANRVLVALNAADKNGWTIGTSAVVLAAINQ